MSPPPIPGGGNSLNSPDKPSRGAEELTVESPNEVEAMLASLEETRESQEKLEKDVVREELESKEKKEEETETEQVNEHVAEVPQPEAAVVNEEAPSSPPTTEEPGGEKVDTIQEESHVEEQSHNAAEAMAEEPTPFVTKVEPVGQAAEEKPDIVTEETPVAVPEAGHISASKEVTLTEEVEPIPDVKRSNGYSKTQTQAERSPSPPNTHEKDLEIEKLRERLKLVEQRFSGE